MIGFALCHGWSFDSRALVPLRSTLLQHFPEAAIAMFDLGFTGTTHFPPLCPSRKWIAVGHSYGFAYLIQQSFRWEAAISLNGFTRFCRRPGHPAGTPARVVDTMLDLLASNPRGVVETFYDRCGASHAAPDALDSSQLRQHLAQLRDIDMTPPACATLALFTQEDSIVPPSLTQACFQTPQCTLRQFPGSHMFLLQEPTLWVPDAVHWIEKVYA